MSETPNPTMKSRVVTCVFYSHAWAAHMLNSLGLGDLSRAVVVEVSVNSVLAPVFNDSSPERPGVAGLLRGDATVATVARKCSGFDYDIVLASRPPVPVATTASGVGLLRTAEGSHEQMILMVHLSEAAMMIHAFADADRFAVLWDLADTPNLALADLGILLARHHCLTADSWAGLHFYSHPKRKLADSEERKARYEQIFADYPAVAQARLAA
jgi:hypothetical protein